MSNPLLQARELRWQTRQTLAARHEALVSVTLRSPAALRQQANYLKGFDQLCAQLEQALPGLQPLLTTLDADGPARHYAAPDAGLAKAQCIQFEEQTPGGGLLDIDVMNASGQALGRAELHQPARACAVCGERPATLCIRPQRHDETETRQAFDRLLSLVPDSDVLAQRIGGWALRAMLYEVSVSPKPGLVDRFDQGAHGDMDYYSFIDSALALSSYFVSCARLGADWQMAPEGMLAALRPLGIQAEQDMLRATGGVNTHKGLVFSLGILCAAAGRLQGQAPPQALCALAARIATPALDDRQSDQPSHGEKVRARHGDRGVRGEAAAGFPAALGIALPQLQKALGEGRSPDEAGLLALLQLMASLRDTNVLHRGGAEGLRFMQAGARELLAQGLPKDKLSTYCEQMVARRLSPGGCADLLCVAFFLLFSTQPGPLPLT